MPTQTTAAARERYLTLIEATLRQALAERLDRPLPSGLTMEMALPAIARKLGMVDIKSPWVVSALTRWRDASLDGAVRDGAEQTRSIYRPLLTRAFGSQRKLRAATPIREANHRVIVATEAFAIGRELLASSDGASVAAHAFEAAAAFDAIVRDRSRAEKASVDAFSRIVSSQDASGRFLARTPADQLEPAWYHELAMLHAVTLYALRSGDAKADAAVRRSARYHAAEVQPDHASSHPFGLAALLDDADGIHLADMMLHAAGVQQPATMDAVSLVLLFDALDCGRRAKPA